MEINKIDELLKIKELLDSGIITESDFKRKKDELLNSNNEISNSQKKDEIIIGENEKECPSCKCIIDKESKICKFCDYDFINKQIFEKSNIPPVESNSNLKKYISISLVAIVFIFLITIAFTGTRSDNTEFPQADTTKVDTVNPTVDSTSINPKSADPSAPISEPYIPTVQNTESHQEVDEGGDYNDDTSENIDSNGSTITQTNTSYKSSINIKDIQSSYFYGSWLFGDSNITFMENGNCIIKDLYCKYTWTYNKGILKMTSPNGCAPSLENKILTFYEDSFTYKETQEKIFRKAVKME